MKAKSIRLPRAVLEEIAIQAAVPDVPPQVLTAQDRDHFLGSTPREFQTAAEVEWNRTVDDNDRRREEWLARVVTVLTPLLNGNRSSHLITAIGRNPIRTPQSDVMVSEEAAAYLRHSVSWLLRQPDIAYIRGTPNLYRKVDLDDWLKRHTQKPRGI